MEDYIDLDRRFITFDPNAHGERDQFSHAPFNAGKSWDAVLEQPCTVIIAEAGNGKSVELTRQAQLLRGRGEAAFFANLALLAKLPLPRALEVGTADDLSSWQEGAEHGFFLLDAVDEAKLADPRDFQVALANYLDAVEAYKERTTTIISTRPHAWRAYADRALLAARLGLPPPRKATSATTDPGEEPVAAAGSSEESEDDEGGSRGNPRSPLCNSSRWTRHECGHLR